MTVPDNIKPSPLGLELSTQPSGIHVQRDANVAIWIDKVRESRIGHLVITLPSMGGKTRSVPLPEALTELHLKIVTREATGITPMTAEEILKELKIITKAAFNAVTIKWRDKQLTDKNYEYAKEFLSLIGWFGKEYSPDGIRPFLLDFIEELDNDELGKMEVAAPEAVVASKTQQAVSVATVPSPGPPVPPSDTRKISTPAIASTAPTPATVAPPSAQPPSTIPGVAPMANKAAPASRTTPPPLPKAAASMPLVQGRLDSAEAPNVLAKVITPNTASIRVVTPQSPLSPYTLPYVKAHEEPLHKLAQQTALEVLAPEAEPVLVVPTNPGLFTKVANWWKDRSVRKEKEVERQSELAALAKKYQREAQAYQKRLALKQKEALAGFAQLHGLSLPEAQEELARAEARQMPRVSPGVALIAAYTIATALAVVGHESPQNTFGGNHDALVVPQAKKTDPIPAIDQVQKPAAPEVQQNPWANAEIVDSTTFDSGSAESVGHYQGDANMFVGSVDADPIQNVWHPETWHKTLVEDAALLYKFLMEQPGRLHPETLAYAKAHEELLRDLAQQTDFHPQRFFNRFAHYDRAELYGSKGIINCVGLAIERIKFFAGMDNDTLFASGKLIWLKHGDKRNSREDRYAAALKFAVAKIAPLTVPAQDAPVIKIEEDAGKTGLHFGTPNSQNEAQQLAQINEDWDIPVEVDLSELHGPVYSQYIPAIEKTPGDDVDEVIADARRELAELTANRQQREVEKAREAKRALAEKTDFCLDSNQLY